MILSVKETYILFNDTLSTSILQLYGVAHMVKDHSDNERGNPLPLFKWSILSEWANY